MEDKAAVDAEIKRRSSWQRWLLDDEVDDEGWQFGWCPLHDAMRRPHVPTAQYNIARGVMRCLAEGDLNCHKGKRAISLQNVGMRMIDVATQ